MDDIDKYQKERQELNNKLQSLEQEKNIVLLRLAEIQGVLKYIQEKKLENKKNGS